MASFCLNWQQQCKANSNDDLDINAHLTIVYSTHFFMWLMCAYDERMRPLSSQSGNCYNDRCWYNINASNKCSSFYFFGFSSHLVNFFLSLFLKFLFHLAGWLASCKTPHTIIKIGVYMGLHTNTPLLPCFVVFFA